MRLHEIQGQQWFHRTTPNRVKSIQRNGLIINGRNNLTKTGKWAFEVYGCRPIFLSQTLRAAWAETAYIVFDVNVDGLSLIADLPSLTDHGAYYDVEDWVMWFKDGPEWSFDDLLNPSSEICHEAIKLTKTAACIVNIPPERLHLNQDSSWKGW